MPKKCKFAEILTRNLGKKVEFQLMFGISAQKKSKLLEIFTRITNFGWSAGGSAPPDPTSYVSDHGHALTRHKVRRDCSTVQAGDKRQRKNIS